MDQQATVLVVEPSEEQEREAAEAITQQTACHVVVRRSADEALDWLATQSADVCVLDYALPDMDGLDAFQRIKHAHPRLAVVMTSESRDDAIAAAALRGGVRDIVPRQPGWAAQVATLVAAALAERDAHKTVRAQEAAAHLPPNVPASLIQPTYENRLRAIGRRLDLAGATTVSLCEVRGGFVGRAITGETAQHAEILEFADDQFVSILAEAVVARGEGYRPSRRSPLAPTGYADLLRALGYQLDQQAISMVAVIETPEKLVVSGLRRAVTATATQALEPYTLFLDTDGCRVLLNVSFTRRGLAPNPERPATWAGIKIH